MASPTRLLTFASGVCYNPEQSNSANTTEKMKNECLPPENTTSITMPTLVDPMHDLSQITREFEDTQHMYNMLQSNTSLVSMHPEYPPGNDNENNHSRPSYRNRGRRRGRGVGRIANRAIRTSVTFQHKLEVIDFYEAHEKDINATIHKFYSHLDAIAIASRKRQIYKWVKCRKTIEEMCFRRATAHQTRRRIKGTATTLSDEAEQELISWIRVEQARNRAVSKQMLKIKALEIAEKYDVPKGTFQATWTWQKGFFKRHRMDL